MISTDTFIRVRYADTDQMKYVYYGKFFEYFEQGRSDFLRTVGMPYPEIERLGFMLPVMEAHAEYIKPAFYDEEIVVRTMVEEMPAVRVRIKYIVSRGSPEEILARGYTVHAFIDAAKRVPVRAPADFLKLMEAALKS
jgi:acyl-CoA thioester hydrolase